MPARTAAKKRTAKKALPQDVRKPRSGEGNPSWGKAFVTASRRQNWKRTSSMEREDAPLTLSAAPGVVKDRIKVSIAESFFADPLHDSRFGLEIEVCSGARGSHMINAGVSLEQLHSFEEAVRAVFQSAREEGILPRAKEWSA
jgi:hypothetical protein